MGSHGEFKPRSERESERGRMVEYSRDIRLFDLRVARNCRMPSNIQQIDLSVDRNCRMFGPLSTNSSIRRDRRPPMSARYVLSSGERRLRRSSPRILSAQLRGAVLPRSWAPLGSAQLRPTAPSSWAGALSTTQRPESASNTNPGLLSLIINRIFLNERRAHSRHRN